MRWGALLVGCVIAACGGGTGVDIDVIVPSDVELDRVELWVAYTECSDCANGVAWPSSGERASGNIYLLHDEQVVKAIPQGDRWVLHLDAASGYSAPPWLAVVGMKGSDVVAVKVLRDVRIPASTVVTWQVYLHPAHEATTDLATPPSDPAFDHRARVWSRAPTAELAEPTGCLAYQDWDGTTWDTEYFVPKSDPDCDGVSLDKECNEYWYDYKAGGNCVSQSLSMLPGACAIGNSPCEDGVSSDTTCGPDTERAFTCLPDAFCAHCSDQVPADTCIAGAIEDSYAANTLPHYDCTFDATSEGQPCPDEKVTILAPMAGAVCATPQLHYVERPFIDPQGTLTFGSGTELVKFSISATVEPCLFVLRWEGGTQNTFSAGITFLLDVPYSNGLRAIYPVHVAPSNQIDTCMVSTTPRPCAIDGLPDDGVVRCAAF